MQYSALFYFALAAATVSAVTIHKVNVGANGQLAYQPNNFQAEIGSFVEFIFFPKNHTVSQSSFSRPCQPLNTTLPQIFSGFVPTVAPGPNAQSFTIKITDQKPIWLYCSQTVGNHCQQGMVAAINAPTTGFNTFANYLYLAKNASTPSRSPSGGVQGGVLAAAGNGGNGGNATYTSTAVTVASSIEYSVTSTYEDATTTYLTVVPTFRSTDVVVVTTYPVQPSTTAATRGPSPTASIIPAEAGRGAVVAKRATLGMAAVGFAWALL